MNVSLFTVLTEVQALDLVGTAYMLLEDPLLAERFLLRAQRVDPSYAKAYLHLGMLYLGTGDLLRVEAELVLGVGDVGSEVLRDRRHLSEDGVLVCVVSVDRNTGEVVAGPDLLSRGFIYARESEELLEAARAEVRAALDELTELTFPEPQVIRSSIRDALRRFLYAEIKRRPMILPVVMEL